MMNSYAQNWEKSKLTPVEDYCFLSDPEASETFIIEFSGKVRLYYENDTPVLPGLRQKADTPYLFKFEPGVRCWKNGFLPVLQIYRNEHCQEELFASGKKLYRCTRGKYFVYPEEEEVTRDIYEKKRCCVEKYWHNFFAKLDEIPDLGSWAENGWKSSFVQSFSAFWGRHTKYGVEEYGCMRHDGFPPTVLAAAGALAEFGNVSEARALVLRYFDRFLRADGSIRYYGTALSEYGGLLRLCSQLSKGEDGEAFFAACSRNLLLFCRLMRDLLDCVMNPPGSSYALLAGSPEADLRERRDEYFHNNGAVLRGLEELLLLLEQYNVRPDLYEVQDLYDQLKRRFDFAVADMSKRFSFLPYRTANAGEIYDFTADLDWAFANYRYYPELLESGLLAPEDAKRIITGRFERKGMFLGLTALNYPAQFLLCFDHWPHISLGRGLLEYGETGYFHQILEAHASLYMCQDLFTCYESELPGTPMKAYTDWCVPAQLVFPRLLKMCTGFTRRDGSRLTPGIPEGLKNSKTDLV